MRSTLLAVLLCLPCCVGASPYFRPVGSGNWNVGDGVSFSAKSLAQTQNVTMLALITHSTKDGSILPQSMVDAGWADAWTPLSVGFAEGNGTTAARFGCSANLSPTATALIKKIIYQASPYYAGKYQALITAMPENLTFAFGPGLGLDVIQGGHFAPINHWTNDPIRYDFLAAWKF